MINLTVEPLEAARLSCFKPLEQVEGGRIALLVAHAPDGRVKPNVPVYCAALRRAGLKVVLIVASDEPFVTDAALTKTLTGGFARDNKGYDFAAWAHVLKVAPKLWRAETLFLLNDSVIGPLSQKRLDDLLHRIGESPADVVGATESWEIEWHLQSYFLALKPRALANETLRAFFDQVQNQPDKNSVIRAYEVALPRLLTEGGLRCAAVYPCHDDLNQTVVHWRALIDHGFPFVKTSVLSGNIPQVNTIGWSETLAAAGFKPSVAAATIAASEIWAGHRSIVETSKLASPPKRQAILVLGMHAGGTSAVAGVISALGAAGPKTLMPPAFNNPRGHFESAVLAVAHDEMLATAGSHWNDWRQLKPQWLYSKAAEQHRQQIKALIIEEFGDEPLIFIKDPRICRFIPFVSSILAKLNVSPVAILSVRNPLEVALSLKRRNKLPVSRSVLLWLRHVLDAEFHSRHMPRTFLSYEKFLTNWRYHMDRVAEKTGVIWPARSDQSDVEIEQFLAMDLYHERSTLEDMRNHPNITSLVRTTYDILTAIAADGENGYLLDQLDVVRTKFDEGCEIFEPVVAAEELAGQQLRRKLAVRTGQAEQLQHENVNLVALSEFRSVEVHRLTAEYNALGSAHKDLIAERDALGSAHKDLIAERDALASAHNNLIAERDAILASSSWRLTAPLRWLLKIFVR